MISKREAEEMLESGKKFVNEISTSEGEKDIITARSLTADVLRFAPPNLLTSFASFVCPQTVATGRKA